MRIPFIAGNWKMNLCLNQSLELVKNLHYQLRNTMGVDIVLAPPAIYLHALAEFLKNSPISLSAQNAHWENAGAYTGELSPLQIRDIGAKYVILGHSERRQYFQETDEMINKKTIAAINNKLTPIVCVGETLQQRKNNSYKAVIETQVTKALAETASLGQSEIILAYEPVWAIGTGETASPDQAQEVHHFIRQITYQIFGPQKAETIRILYGGSMKPTNCKDLLKQKDIDGGLIGNASLIASDFIEIVSAAKHINLTD